MKWAIDIIKHIGPTIGFEIKIAQSIWLISVLHLHEFVLDVGKVVVKLDGLHLWNDVGSLLDFGPSVDLDSQVLLHDVGVGIADRDERAWSHNLELVVLGDQNRATMLVSHDAFSRLVDASLVPLSLSGDLD